MAVPSRHPRSAGQYRDCLSDDPGGLDEQAIVATGQWRFEPGRLAGRPVDVLGTLLRLRGVAWRHRDRGRVVRSAHADTDQEDKTLSRGADRLELLATARRTLEPHGYRRRDRR